MISAVVVLFCGLCALLFALAAARRAQRGHVLAATLNALFAVAMLCAATAAALVGVDLASYARLTHEAPVAELRFRQEGNQRYFAEVLHPDGEREGFVLAGDEWQLDARVLKWRGAATMIGFDSVFRLDRIGGRYRDITLERTAPRTVFELARPRGVDVWSLAQRFHRFLPWVDALYGSATYLPMADGAHYAVSISATGLLARPLNREAREAVAGWH
ncbi:MAG TPA: cation/multidrug efflux pump [Casimicrobiaceae bacterium]|nr:cation/multidrug efflux pump [Casimicrobiaceae bacterium]